MPVCGNYLFFELPKKIVLNPKDGCCHGVRDASFCGLADQFSISYLCGFCEAFPHFLT